jgi:hypothetical protein
LIDLAQEQADTVIVAGDEASLYHQATLMRAWRAIGQTPLIKVTTQRTRTHFYGALNLASGQETVMRTAVMNSDVTTLFLLKLLAAYPERPILILWNRAKWHLGAAVKALLKDNVRLQILFFGCPLGLLRLNSTRKSRFGRQLARPLVIIICNPILLPWLMILSNI